jgi:hypothetical protein
MNLLTIADALAARYAPGVVTPPTGLKNITAATARPPNNIPNTPFVIAWANEGDLNYATTNGMLKGEATFQVAFYYSKAEADIPREYAALMSWAGVLIARLEGQTKLGLAPLVMKAWPLKWEIGALTYAGITYEGITLTVHVWTEEAVTLVP